MFQSAPRPGGSLENAVKQDCSQDASLESLSASWPQPGPSDSSTTVTPHPKDCPSVSPSQRPLDPHFDPPFHNDTHIPERSTWKRLLHFTAKHQHEGLFNAVGKHITSHLEFGACLADYRGLRKRYSRLRELEDVDEIKLQTLGSPPGPLARVRFINYYTLSPGRPKPIQPEFEAAGEDIKPVEARAHRTQDCASFEGSQHILVTDVSSSGSIALVENQPDGEIGLENPVTHSASSEGDDREKKSRDPSEYNRNDDAGNPTRNQSATLAMDSGLSTMRTLDPIPLIEEPAAQKYAGEELGLPAVPDAPERPEASDLEQLTDKDSRKQAEKEDRRRQKAYERAVKDRDKAIQERNKLIEKQRKKAAKEEAKRLREEAKQPLASPVLSQNAGSSEQHEEPSSRRQASPTRDHCKKSKKKLKTFCYVPGSGGDQAWIDVYMEGMDEVAAHCGLFLPGAHYDKLIGDVGMRVAAWVHEDLTKKAILEGGC